MSKIAGVRGTKDYGPEDQALPEHVMSVAAGVSGLYGHARVETPILERIELFQRTLGETSDVVSKEMYLLDDRGGDRLALRPEGTASVARAASSNGWLNQLPLRVFYAGPFFRYERPQKGRLRQFRQIGVETLGATEPEADAEVIACGHAILKRLGVDNRVNLLINSLGNQDDRDRYRTLLRAYLEDHRGKLSEDSKIRLARNPLRILDSKALEDQEILRQAPKLKDHLCQDSKDHMAKVLERLNQLDIPWTEAPNLVRGLDYYQHTAFEFVLQEERAQNAVMAGGRYDGLIQAIGGPDVAGVGWAAGVERLSMLISDSPQQPRPVLFAAMDDATREAAWKLMEQARSGGVPSEMLFSGSLKKQFRRADRIRARLVVLIGQQELEKGELALKEMDSGTQSHCPMDQLMSRLATS